MKRSPAVLWIAMVVCSLASTRLAAQVPNFPIAPAQEQLDFLSSWQQPSQDPPATSSADSKPAADDKPALPDAPQPKAQSDEAQQTKRILWIIPNFRSVSASTYLPPLSFKQKLWLATQDSFDYSGFAWVAIVSGIAMGSNSEPSFGGGISGYGVYYAHNFADNTIENFMVEAIVPAATKQDPRYYTLGHGGFLKRTGYSVSRLFITRQDSGSTMFNFSEVVGAGAAAGIGNLYYPSSNNAWVKTYQRWGSQIIQDGLGNIAKEFWPDINRAVFHNKY